MNSKHKIARNSPLTPDFSRPIPKQPRNPFPERSAAEAALRAAIRQLNSQLAAERKKHSFTEGIFVAQKKRDDQQISDLRKLVFAGIVIPVGEKQ